MTAVTTHFDQQQRSVRVPLWREAWLVPEWLRLRATPVFYGRGIPRGKGAAVVTIPGFLCSDLYTSCLTNWLRRIDYRAYPSHIERNNECIETVLQRVAATIEHAATETRGPVHLIGHSLGGMLARMVTIQRPEHVASVITLASPFRGVRAHPYILWLARRVRGRVQRAAAPQCFTGFCPCPSVTALQCDWPASVPTWAIYTKADGIVDWRACLNDDPARNVEVSGTHVGLVFNPAVYRFIAEQLALL